jgi:hypothetical protein
MTRFPDLADKENGKNLPTRVYARTLPEARRGADSVRIARFENGLSNKINITVSML